jgi:hypothetical protein
MNRIVLRPSSIATHKLVYSPVPTPDVMKKHLLLAVFLLPGVFLFAQQAGRPGETPARSYFYLCPDDVAWKDAAAPLPPGARVYLVEGNPKDSGQFTLRVWMPPWFKIPPHVHPVAERTTVLSGTLNAGYGDTMDTLHATHYTSGCFYYNPPGAVHYTFTSGEAAIIQISTTGPWGLSYFNGQPEKEITK